MDAKDPKTETKEQKKARQSEDAAQAWAEHLAHQKAVDDNMMRLRNERLARQSLPRTQGEKEKPGHPGRKSKNQNVADRP